jgi:hypothetical protein
MERILGRRRAAQLVCSAGAIVYPALDGAYNAAGLRPIGLRNVPVDAPQELRRRRRLVEVVGM